MRDQRASQAALAQLTPGSLGAILRETELGIIIRWADLCDRMVAVDAHVRANMEGRIAAVSASRWIVEKGETGDAARDAHAADCAQFVERALRSCHDFEQCVHDLLDGIGKGAAVSEIGWAVDGDTIVPAHLWWIHLRRFRWSRYWDLRLVDDGDMLHAQGIPLEPQKFIVHSPRPTAGYPTMTGVLRSVVWPYLFKRWAQQFWVAGAERFAWPLIWAKVPRDAGDAIRQKAQDGIDTLSADHAAVVEDPVAFQLLESNMKDGGTWKGLTDMTNAEISKGCRGITDATEPGKVGAYGAVEARIGVSVDPRISLDERGIATTIRRDLITPLVEFNRHRWGGIVPAIPTVRWMISSKAVEIPSHFARAARTNEVRASINLPPLSGPEGEALYNPDENSAPATSALPSGEPSGAPKAQEAALNGAQVQSLMQIVTAVATGQIPRETGISLITSAFPIDAQKADEIMGSVGRGFVPATAPPAAVAA